MESQSFRVQNNSFRVIKAKFQSSRARFHCIQHIMKLISRWGWFIFQYQRTRI